MTSKYVESLLAVWPDDDVAEQANFPVSEVLISLVMVNVEDHPEEVTNLLDELLMTTPAI